MVAEPGTVRDPSSAIAILISGPPGAGKSTIGRAVAERFPKSAHLKVDDLREIMVNGFEPPGVWTDAHDRQFRRARTVAAQIARLHLADGITIVIDDVCVPGHFEEHHGDLFAGPAVHRIMLAPTRAALEARLRARNGPWDHVLLASGPLDWCYEILDDLPLTGWTIIDSSDQSVEETVEAVLGALGGARS